MLRDAHIHLQDAKGFGEKILLASSARGVGEFFCNGSAPSDWSAVKGLADRFDSVVPFFGVHPWYLDEAGEGWEKALRTYINGPRAGIGEIGLDRAKRKSKPEDQEAIFRRQVEIAIERDLPFTIHCVRAWEALLNELIRQKFDRRRSPPFIVHWFSGSPETALELAKLGAYISFSPRLIDDISGRERESFLRLPAERVLLETDYPYMPGVREPGVEDYFSTLESLYRYAAKLKGMREDEFIKTVWNNGTVFVH